LTSKELGFLVGVGFLLMLISGNKPVWQARGIRNNNPGNIRENERIDYDWIGEAVTDNDGDFEVFISPEYGIRAIGRILDTYARRGVQTVEGIIYTWAPPSENDSASYLSNVVTSTGFGRNAIVGRSDYLALVKAIIKHENGIQPYSDDLIHYGLNLA
jgi:hypothetical protein